MTYSAAMFAAPGEDLETAQLPQARDARAQGGDPRRATASSRSGAAGARSRSTSPATRGCPVTALTLSPAQHRLATERVRAAGVARPRGGAPRRTGATRRAPSTASSPSRCSRPWAAGGGRPGSRPWTGCSPRAAWWRSRRSATPTVGSRRTRATATGSRSGSSPAAPRVPAACSPTCSRGTRPCASTTSRTWASTTRETLRRWRERFLARLDDVRALGFDDRFVRTWEYYLAVCEARVPRAASLRPPDRPRPGRRRAPARPGTEPPRMTAPAAPGTVDASALADLVLVDDDGRPARLGRRVEGPARHPDVPAPLRVNLLPSAGRRSHEASAGGR